MPPVAPALRKDMVEVSEAQRAQNTTRSLAVDNTGEHG